MTYLTERQAMRLAERLRDLPRLARTASAGGPGGTTIAAPLPPGTDLASVDAGREQPHLLAKLCECVRVIADEEMPASVCDGAPDRADVPTWASESGWLVATMGWWQADDWCAEWVVGIESEIRGALVGLIEQHSGYRTCGICGGPIEAYQQGDYAMAECPACERVIGMQEVGYALRIAAARELLRKIAG